jgi:hypothetical protein
VRLPGREPEAFEVGSGIHHWSYPYQGPHDLPAPSLDSALDDLYADPPSWNAVLACLLTYAPNLMGRVVTTQRLDGAVSLRQIVSSASRSGESAAALLHQFERLLE